MKVVALLVLAVAGVAHAQPGAGPPPQQPQGQQQQYPPPPHHYQPYGHPVGLTREEHELLLEGEISQGAHIGGGLAALFFGFGSGQAIQGRWSDTGWIFTLGETASLVAVIGGVARAIDDCDTAGETSCDHSDGPPLIVVGLIGFTVFHIWEVVDAFSGPNDHNRRVRELKFRLGVPVKIGERLLPYLNKTRDGGATAGLQLRF